MDVIECEDGSGRDHGGEEDTEDMGYKPVRRILIMVYARLFIPGFLREVGMSTRAGKRTGKVLLSSSLSGTVKPLHEVRKEPF